MRRQALYNAGQYHGDETCTRRVSSMSRQALYSAGRHHGDETVLVAWVSTMVRRQALVG